MNGFTASPFEVPFKYADWCSDIHSVPSEGYGWLMVRSRGEHDFISEFLRWADLDLKKIEEQGIYVQSELEKLKSLSRLCEEWAQRNVCIVHGDVKIGNLHWDSDGLILLDWDRIGSMPPEYDFQNLIFLLSSADFKTLIDNYEYSERLDMEFCRHFGLLNSLRLLALSQPDQGEYQRVMSQINLILRELK